MMQSNIVKSLGGSQYPNYPMGGDPYGSKALGGNTDLAGYYENELLPYWNAIQNGEIQASPEEMAQLQQWLQYCQYELGQASSAWNGGGYPGQNMPPTGDPMGQGAQGQATYTQDVNEFTVDGSVPLIDVWGNEAIINVPPPCTVEFETVTDDRLEDGETVVRAIITNPTILGPDGQPKQTKVIIHDGAAITCNASEKADGTSRCTDGTGSVTIGKYSDKPESTTPESSMEGAVQEDGSILYQPEVWDASFIINFFAKPGNGDQVHIVNANANISCPPDSTVNVEMLADGTFVVTVKHQDGSSDTYKVAPPSTVNVNANPLQTELDGQAFESVPSEMADRLTINGTDNATGETDLSSPQAIVDSLMAGIQPAISEEQFLGALVEHGYLSDGQTMEDFYEKIAAGDFPGDPTDKEAMEKLLNFLKYVDGDANGLFNDCFTAEDLDVAASALKDRLITLLGPLYPDVLVRSETEASQLSIGETLVNFNLYSWKGETSLVIQDSEQDIEIRDESQQETEGAEEAAEAEAAESAVFNEYVASLDYLAGLSGLGRNSPEFFMKLKEIYGAGIDGYDNAPKDGVLSDEEFKAMLNAGYLIPPASPDLNFVKVIYKLDPDFKFLVEQYRTLSNMYRDSGLNSNFLPGLRAAQKQVRDKLVELLKGAYGSRANICAADDTNSIIFNGQEFDIYMATQAGKLAFDAD